ncbi:hypothetical protein [Burkholderia cepacia]|uniref:hypothetical protein n=1 Tax=Burkholderia cepacia TaxID=292 RepID=UPI001E48E672|nr:hypothetical protein [Burkholderia cepacia]
MLLILAAATLAGGGVCVAFGQPSLARFAWLLGTLPVLLALTVSLVKAVMRRQAGIDVLAWLAIALAVVLDETLAAAVIALMLASGRTLERYAQDRAQREMSALLGRAPRQATRPENRGNLLVRAERPTGHAKKTDVQCDRESKEIGSS